MAQSTATLQDDFWLFGYGPKPPYMERMLKEAASSLKLCVGHEDRRVPGYINGYVRRFWQASEDHRGTPTSPGRVVTLISHSHFHILQPAPKTPSQSSTVWGAAYHIPPEHVSEVQSYLDIREINGYSIQYTPFQPADPTLLAIGKCMVYIGLPENPQFLGVQDPDELARHIWRSKGPSGENKEYLFMLEEALKGLGDEAGDEHIEDLARRVRDVGKSAGGMRHSAEDSSQIAKVAVEGEIAKAKSRLGSHEQDEIEKV